MRASVAGLEYEFLCDTKIRANLNLYFSMKKRYDFSFSQQEEKDFVESVSQWIGRQTQIIIPQSTGKLLEMIARHCSDDIVILQKRSKQDIWELLNQIDA